MSYEPEPPTRPAHEDPVGGWLNWAVVALDGLLVLAAFLPCFLTGIATAAGSTGWPTWLAPVLIVLGPLLGLAVLVGNGGVLAGRGQSLAMRALDVSLVDAHGGHPIGTSRAVTRALLSFAPGPRIGDGPSFADRQAAAVLVRGLPEQG